MHMDEFHTTGSKSFQCDAQGPVLYEGPYTTTWLWVYFHIGGGCGFLGKTFDRFTITHCGFGEAANSGGPAYMSLPESKAPVCHQPPHTK